MVADLDTTPSVADSVGFYCINPANSFGTPTSVTGLDTTTSVICFCTKTSVADLYTTISIAGLDTTTLIGVFSFSSGLDTTTSVAAMTLRLRSPVSHHNFGC